MPAAKIYDLEENRITREKKLSESQITWTLNFTQLGDEKLYRDSLKNLFFLPTFLPIMAIFIVFTALESGLVTGIVGGDAFLIIAFVAEVAAFLLILMFSAAQLIDFFHSKMPRLLKGYVRYVIHHLFGGLVPETILLLHSLGQGCYLLSFPARDLCAGCSSLTDIRACEDISDKTFPMTQAFFGYITIIILPIYFKSIHRHTVLAAWAILTVFVIAAYLYGGYSFQYYTVLFVVFFFVSIFEFERYKMTAYLLSKQAILAEQCQAELVKEKSKLIETKLRTALIHQILPPRVADTIIAGKPVMPESFPDVTIFFSDVEGFTTICSKVTPAEVVRMLNELYTVMDYCTSLFPLYKVETIGDAYMVVGGLPVKDKNHAQQVADFALLVQSAVQSVKSPIDGTPIRIRIGLHSGPVMAGVVGNLMPRYCLFGDTVNTASRMESNGVAGKIHCSGATAQLLTDGKKHIVEERGAIEIKGKGTMTTFWLQRATDDNPHSNAGAIIRTNTIVQELLETSQNDQKVYSSLGMVTSPPASPPASPRASPSPPRRNRNSSTLTETQTFTMDTVQAFSSTQESASTAVGSSPARHTLQYNFHHMMSEGGLSAQKYCAEYAKILVVEDSNAQRKIIIKRLSDADKTWEMTGAASGEEALQKLKAAKFKFDVVFVDENLSVNNGLYGHELVQVMRDSFNMQLTVICACTSNPTKVGKELMDAGVDVVWPKPPPSPAEIKEKINFLLNQRWLRFHQQSEMLRSPTSQQQDHKEETANTEEELL